MVQRENFMKRKRRGLNMVELLGVMAVLAILIGIGAGSISSAQRKARLTSAQQSIAAYRGAFINATTVKPAIIQDRLNKWGEDGADYSTEEAMARLVSIMNEFLDEKLVMYWDEELLCYRSVGEDPWGGFYILTEYPIGIDGTSRYDPTSIASTELTCSVWATGASDEILESLEISEDACGVALVYSNGLCVETYTGFDEEYPLSGWTLQTFK